MKPNTYIKLLLVNLILICLSLQSLQQGQDNILQSQSQLQKFKDLKLLRSEQIEKYRLNKQQNKNIKNRNLNSNQGTTPEPIRITFDYSRIQDISNEGYKNAIIDALEISKKYFYDLLKVYPELNPIVVEDSQIDDLGSEGYSGQCIATLDFSDTLGDDTSTGIQNSDLHIYVTYSNEEQQTLAWASPCQWYNYRSLVGQINFNLNWFEQSYTGAGSSFEYNYETALHELFHIIGFAGTSINEFLTEQNGQLQLITQQELDQIKDSNYSWMGKTSIMLKSQNVLQAVRDHFNCQEIEGALLENEGPDGTKNDHWERTLFNNELLTAAGIQSDAVVSELTLAFLKDSNWYQNVNMDMAEDLQWGKSKGCEFFNQACQNQESYQEFYDTTIENTTMKCSFYHFGVGQSVVESFTDGCPVISIYSNTHCTDDQSYEEDLIDKTGENYQYNSKCFESTFINENFTYEPKVRCYPNKCFNNQLIISIGNTNVICEEDGQEIQAPSGYNGTLQCPESISQFCEFPVPCENYCSSKGYCLRKQGQSKCFCIDGYYGKDCSQQCQNGICPTQDDCNQDEIYDEGTKTCNKCHISCQSQSCTGPSIEECNLCPENQFYTGLGCKDECLQGTYQLENSQICVQCTEDKCPEQNNNNNGNNFEQIIKPTYLLFIIILLSLIIN